MYLDHWWPRDLNWLITGLVNCWLMYQSDFHLGSTKVIPSALWLSVSSYLLVLMVFLHHQHPVTDSFNTSEIILTGHKTPHHSCNVKEKKMKNKNYHVLESLFNKILINWWSIRLVVGWVVSWFSYLVVGWVVSWFGGRMGGQMVWCLDGWSVALVVGWVVSWFVGCCLTSPQ